MVGSNKGKYQHVFYIWAHESKKALSPFYHKDIFDRLLGVKAPLFSCVTILL